MRQETEPRTAGWHGGTAGCPQCGAPVALPEGGAYARCAHCGSSSFVDLTGALMHQMIRTSIPRSRVPAHIRTRAREAGWPSAALTELDLVYEPVWELEAAGGRPVRVAGRAGADGRVGLVELPGGERGFVEPDARRADEEWLEPELAPEAAAEAAARMIGRPVSASVIRLVHRPVYTGRIRVAGLERRFRLDAVTAQLLDADWPVRPSFRNRNLAWTAIAAMVLAAVALPFPWAALAATAIGVVAAALFAGRAPSARGSAG